MATPRSSHYPGPLPLAEAKSQLHLSALSDAAFTSDGPRADVEYRDLGLAAATDGRIGAKHIRAASPPSSRPPLHDFVRRGANRTKGRRAGLGRPLFLCHDPHARRSGTGGRAT